MSKILVIQAQDIEYKFFFTKLEEWKISFSNVRSNEGTLDKFQTNSVSSQSVADELLKLKSLMDAGVITEDEFQSQKEKLLNS